MRDELNGSLARFGAARLSLPASEGSRLSASLLQHLLTIVVKPGTRRLTQAELLKLLDEATRVSLVRSDVDVLIAALAKSLDAGQNAPEIALRSRSLEPEADLPFPSPLTRRPDLVTATLEHLRQHGAAVLTGGTGMGKTIIARLCAKRVGGEWFVLDLRGEFDFGGCRTLARCPRGDGRSAAPWHHSRRLQRGRKPKVRAAAARLIAAARRRDVPCVFTLYRELSARTCSEIGIARSATIAVPNLTREEVGELIAEAGGDPRQWSDAVHSVAAFGHPQLVHATITGLRARSWPMEEFRRMRGLDLSGPDVETERRAARQRLIATVPDAARTLLYRLSLVIGRFDRRIAIALGGITPSVPSPGEHLDQLIGAWIDQTGGAELRMSPLVSNAANDVLAPAERTVVHRTIAETVMQERKIDVARANAAFLHGLLGGAQPPLLKIAYSIITARPEIRSMLAEWLIGLRLHRTDRPIFPASMRLSRMLRLAQFLLRAGAGNDEAVREAWNALFTETQQETDGCVARLVGNERHGSVGHGWSDQAARSSSAGGWARR